jgi:DNA (cytosine-5)-methyltransferase 1
VPYAQGGTPLSLAVKWPTPTVCGNHNRKGASATSGDGLATAVKKWPTPTAGADCLGAFGGSNARAVMRTLVSESELYGPLNPTWVEWLMGWPLGWTDLKPLETGKSRCVQQLHGSC